MHHLTASKTTIITCNNGDVRVWTDGVEVMRISPKAGKEMEVSYGPEDAPVIEARSDPVETTGRLAYTEVEDERSPDAGGE